MSATATAGDVAAGASTAVAVSLDIPAGDQIGPVAATVSSTAAMPPADPLQTTDATFVADPLSPSVRATVHAAASVARAVVVVVCSNASGVVGGGTTMTGPLAAGSATTVTAAAAATDTPASCTGYSRQA